MAPPNNLDFKFVDLSAPIRVYFKKIQEICFRTWKKKDTSFTYIMCDVSRSRNRIP